MKWYNADMMWPEQVPYGVKDFKRIRLEGRCCVDKTLFCETPRCCCDVAGKGNFCEEVAFCPAGLREARWP